MFSSLITRGFIFYVLASSFFVSADDLFDIFPDSKKENEIKDNTLELKVNVQSQKGFIIHCLRIILIF